MEVKKAYKFRIYPNKEQEKSLAETIGACRYIYNYYLNLQINTYFQTGKSLSYNQLSKDLTQLRKQTDWLSDVQYMPLQQSLRQLDVAYNRYFRKVSKFPKFKSKKRNDGTLRKLSGWSLKGNKLFVQRGLEIRCRGSLPKNVDMRTLTIRRTATGKWFASIAVIEVIKQPELKGSVGVDMGITHTAITSEGKKFDNLKLHKAQLKKLKKLQQQFARQTKGSNRRNKTRLLISRLHEKIANQRMNHLHQVSNAITGKNHALIAVESLSVVNMIKNRHLSRSIADVSWGELLRQLEYKQLWKGGEFVKVDRFFPSSKRCSACGDMQSAMPLNIREWYCNSCLTTHDRDVNAAKNILQQAEAQLVGESTEGSRKARVTGSMKRGYANA